MLVPMVSVAVFSVPAASAPPKSRVVGVIVPPPRVTVAPSVPLFPLLSVDAVTTVTVTLTVSVSFANS